MNRQRRTTLLLSRRAGGPASEVVALNAMSFKSGTVTGGPADTAAGCVTALSDGSDTTYLQATGTSGSVFASTTTDGFADLQNANGRGIASFVIKFRASASGATGTVSTASFTNVTPASTSSGVTVAVAGAADYTTTSYTKSGGGTWTVAEINSMTFDLSVGSGSGATRTYRIFELSVEVTYA